MLEILADVTKTAKELSEIFDVAEVTIYRWRKKYGIKVPKGSKKGKPKPWLAKEKIVSNCKHCNKEIIHVPCDNRVYCSRSCMYKSDEYIDKLRNIDRAYMQTETYHKAKSKKTTPAYRKYAGTIHRLSQKIYEQNEKTINPDGYIRTVCGVEGGYQLDHIIPVRFGFDNNIPVEEVARLENLRVIPWKQNLKKGKKVGES